MAAVANLPLGNAPFQSQNVVGSGFTQSAYECDEAGNSANNEVKKPKEVENSDIVNQIVEAQNSSDSDPSPQGVRSRQNSTAWGQAVDEENHHFKTSLNDVKIQANNSPKTILPPQGRQLPGASESSADKDQEFGEKNSEAKNIHNSYPAVHPKSSHKMKPSGFSSNSAVETQKKSSKKDAKKTRSLCCFGSRDTEQYPAPVPAKQIVLATQNNQHLLPAYAPPPSPAPARLPPHVPAPVRDAPSVPSAQSTPEASDDGTSYEEAVQKFQSQENGSETDRDSHLLKVEDQVVETLMKPIYNKKYHYEKTAFQGDERQDELWRRWVEDDFRNLKELQNIIRNTRGLGLASLKEPRYLEFVKVRKKGQGIVEQEQEWKSTLLICFLEQKEVDKFNNRLRHFDTNTWFLKDFKVQVEVRVVEPCAVGSDTGLPGKSPTGTPIFGQKLQSASTLCGMTCHIKGSDTRGDSFCTIGGVLHINKKFFALTSAHPFQDKIGSAREKDAAFETQMGILFSYKFGDPEDQDSKIRSVSDWALILLENQYVRPNNISLEGSKRSIPISGFLPTKDLTMGKVWVCSCRGPQLGVVATNPTIIGMAGTSLKTRSIRLATELVDGDSGSWVVRNGKLCGFIISRAIGEAWAYMLPIEQVFEDIHERLESIWKGEVSTPQTWLEAAMQKPIPQSHSSALDHDRELLVDKGEEKQPELLQGKGSVSAHSDEKATDPSRAEARIPLTSETALSGDSLPGIIEPGHGKEVEFQQISAKGSPVLVQEPPAPSLPSYVPDPVKRIEQVITKSQGDSDSREPSSPIDQNQKLQLAKESAINEIRDKDSDFEKNEKKEKGKGLGKEEPKEERKTNRRTEQDTKQERENEKQKDLQKEEQKDEQKTDQEEKQKKEETRKKEEAQKEEESQKKEETQKKEELDNGEHPREEDVIHNQVPSVSRVEKNTLWRDMSPRVRYYLDNPELISTPMSRVSELLGFEPITYPHPVTTIREKTQIFDLETGNNDIEAVDRNIRVDKTIRDIVIEATIFNDLMSQLLEPVAHINITDRKSEVKKTWWNNSKWRENLVMNANPTKVELILDIIMDEVRLIEKAFRLRRFYRASVFPTSILKLFLARPILKNLVSNNQRLKRLVEGFPSTINYYDQSIHHSAPEKLPDNNIDMVYDCTKYLELYTALEEVRASGGITVGVAVPKFEASESHDEISDALEFLLLERHSEYRYHKRNEWLEEYRPLQWWVMEPNPDSKNISRFRAPDALLDGPSMFASSIRAFDGGMSDVIFKPLPKSMRYDLTTFRELDMGRELQHFPRRIILRMALNLSIGIILLSPTPWYQHDSTRLLKKVLFFHGDYFMDRLVFVTDPLSSEKNKKYLAESSESLLLKLGQALIELALSEEIEEPSEWSDSYIPKVNDLREIIESRLNSGFIALKMGLEYQNIVKVCLYGKYETTSGVKEIYESLPSFQAHANKAIVEPLKALWIKAEEKFNPSLGRKHKSEDYRGLATSSRDM